MGIFCVSISLCCKHLYHKNLKVNYLLMPNNSVITFELLAACWAKISYRSYQVLRFVASSTKLPCIASTRRLIWLSPSSLCSCNGRPAVVQLKSEWKDVQLSADCQEEGSFCREYSIPGVKISFSCQRSVGKEKVSHRQKMHFKEVLAVAWSAGKWEVAVRRMSAAAKIHEISEEWYWSKYTIKGHTLFSN